MSTAVAIRSTDDAALARAWALAWHPVDREDSYAITEIEGEIPRALHGTLYRNGPSQKILPREGYAALHLFDGDGLVHAFRLADGKAHYASAFVKNESFLLEQRLGPSRQSFFNFNVADPAPEGDARVQPNTNVVWHGGKLLALVENAYPFELDPRTLASIGEHRPADPMLGFCTSAHPKIDGVTGQMLLHGYQPIPPFMQLYTIEADGRCSLAEPIETPYPVMMHDLAITEHYVVVVLCPVLFEMQPGVPVREWFRWAPEHPLRFGVKQRSAGGAVRWFDAPTPGFIFHPGNAYEDGSRIAMDACTYLDGAGLLESLQTFRSGSLGPGGKAVPFLYELDLETGRCSERQLDERGAEFPRLDDRRVGHRNRYGYAVMGDGGAVGPGLKSIVRYDRSGGRSQRHDLPAGHYPGEPVFAPRHAGAAESDGFVLTVVFDGNAQRSYLAIFDAQNVDREPLARAHLRGRVPMGFHGNFAAGVV